MDSNTYYSLSDIASVLNRGGGDASSMGGAWWLILLFLFLIGGGGYGRGVAGAPQDVVTQSDLAQAMQAQTSALNQQQILLSSANNNYETARLIDSLGQNVMNQQNANMINLIQEYNLINQTLQNGFAGVSAQISDIGHHMDSCCCNILRQMQQDKYEDLQNQYNVAQTNLSNLAQTQQILGAMGRWVAYPSAAAAA